MTLLFWLVATDAATLATSPAALCDAVERVLVAEVTGVEASYDEQGRIQRQVHATVEHTVKGAASSDVTFVLPGGRVGNEWMGSSEAATVLIDARYLLFLSTVDGELRIQGGPAGAVRVTREGARKGVSMAEALASVEACHEE